MKRIWCGVVMMTAAAVALAQGPVNLTSARPAGKAVRIELIGDSTQTDNAGYGRGFCANLTAAVDCINMARGGASTHTFRELGIWDRAIASKPDYMLIQFGHNDQVTPQHQDRQTPLPQYIENLKRFVTEARAAGVTPVLVTPLTRRNFGSDGKIHSDLTEYCNAMKSVAAEMKTPLIDLQADSIAYLNTQGPDKGQTLGITKKDDSGKTVADKTHLNWAGSYVFGRIVAVDMDKAVPALQKYVRPGAAKLPLEGMKAMNVIDGGPVKIVLVGDSTVAVGGGWGPGFCAVLTKNVTCIDDARNGRSSKSFYDEGLWKKALAEKGDYYLIQFGHNDMPGKGPDRETDPNTTFAANIRRYIAETRAIGAVPVVVTSLSRRTYKDGKVVEDLKPYAAAARQVGQEENVTVVDLNSISTGMLSKMTQEQADQFDASAHPDAKAENSDKAKPSLDRTHLNAYGQKVFGRLVADNLIRTQVELGPDVVGEPAKSAPVAPVQASPTEGK
ncbi:MAG: rhamnogalacturonan acetylesterase [Acidobacteriaceae bacterium]|nr:rhamnogalacturonan acetylesterase [Acidobacteriaceae bacterium]